MQAVEVGFKVRKVVASSSILKFNYWTNLFSLMILIKKKCERLFILQSWVKIIKPKEKEELEFCTRGSLLPSLNLNPCKSQFLIHFLYMWKRLLFILNRGFREDGKSKNAVYIHYSFLKNTGKNSFLSINYIFFIC